MRNYKKTTKKMEQNKTLLKKEKNTMKKRWKNNGKEVEMEAVFRKMTLITIKISRKIIWTERKTKLMTMTMREQ